MLRENKVERAKVGVYDDSKRLEFTGKSVLKGCFACGGVFISLYITACIIIISFSVFWSSRSLYLIVSGRNPLLVSLASS